MNKTQVVKPDFIITGDVILETAFSDLANAIHLFQEMDEETMQHVAGDKGYLLNHAMVADIRNGILMVDEAVAAGIMQNNFQKDYVINSKCKQLLLLRPRFTIDEIEAQKFLDEFININKGFWKNLWKGKTHYAFGNLLAFAVYYTTNRRIWLGTSSLNTRAFCCGHFAAFFCNHFMPNLFEDPPKISPVDLFLSPMFDHYIIDRTV